MRTIEVKARLLGVAFYFGLAGFVTPSRLGASDTRVRHHHRQALGVFVFLFALLAVECVLLGLDSCLGVFHRVIYESGPNAVIDGMQILLVGAGVLAWASGLSLACCNSSRSLPGIARLMRRERLLRLARIGCIVLVLGTLVLGGLALHSSVITRNDGPGDAYMLYDDMGCVPRWVFCLGFYRISLAARERWGAESVVVALLTQQTLREALGSGRFVFVASHGYWGMVASGQIAVAPFDGIVRESVGERLAFVYITACEGGFKAAAWEEALRPAKVITFNRLSAVVEHIYWLWFSGASAVRAVPETDRDSGLACYLRSMIDDE